MITAPAWHGKRYAVLGLARSGRATVEALLASGAEVVAWDGDAEKRAAFEGRVTLADPVESDLTGFAAVVVSPGVPLNTHPIAAKAAHYGVPVIGDIELFAQARADLPPHKLVGITGTNGKSTTTALVHHILKTAGVPTTMGGNIGLPILEQEPLPEGGVYVLELSSYQIDLTYSLDCDVAVLLNVTPDHLDRYESFEAYCASKERLLSMQSNQNFIIFGGSFLSENPDMFARWFTPERDNVWTTELTEVRDEFEMFGPREFDDWFSTQKDWPALQGPHNAENSSVAINVGHALNLPDEKIFEALESYRGLPHRMERMADVGGVTWVNDSKGTNTAATAPALAAFDNVHWIVGGLAKEPKPGENLLGECEAQLGHVKAAYTIGQSGPDFGVLLAGKVPVEPCETLAVAVERAAAAAVPGDTVLLSPACASFDQFRDFEERGEAFRALVEGLVA